MDFIAVNIESESFMENRVSSLVLLDEGFLYLVPDFQNKIRIHLEHNRCVSKENGILQFNSEHSLGID